MSLATAPILSTPVEGPMAWRGSDLRKDDIAFDLSPAQAAALEDVLLRVRKARLPLREIGLEHCRHPALDFDLARVFDEIQDRRGIVIVRGVPVAAHSVDDVSTMFWALGAHFGRGVSQSARGDVLGLVRDETPPGQAESARGYTSRRELSLHVDLGQIVGLMCVRQARGGGLSQYASGLAIHNEILATRPDLMPGPVPRLPLSPPRRASARRRRHHALRHPGVQRTRRQGQRVLRRRDLQRRLP